MSEIPPPLPPKLRPWPLIFGILVADAVGGGLYFGVIQMLAYYKGAHERDLAVPSLVLVPFIAGLVAAWCWRKEGYGIGMRALLALAISVVGIAGAAIFLGEGAVCLVMVSPIVYLMIVAGLLAGRFWFKIDRSKLQLSIFPVLALLTAADVFHRSNEMAVVTDEILIHATPSQVWPHVLAFPEIPDRPDYWIFQVGLPYPTKTTNGGDFVGASRQCQFSDGITIQERVAEFVPRERLTFDIIEQPTHPEAYGHITLHRGQFTLRENRDGTTTLIGSSWYTLHVRPLWYFDLWTRDMTRAVHLRVMNHVRRLSEEGA